MVWGYRKVRDFGVEVVDLLLKEGNLFERVLTDKNDSCKETNRPDSSTDCYGGY